MVSPHDIEDIYELTPIQQGLLYELARSPGSGVYVEQVTIHLAGMLDTDCFARAWQDIVDRHPILRTSFHPRGNGGPLQVVHRSASLDVTRLDWRGEAGDPEERLAGWLTADRLRGFDLTRPPLMRATLIRRDDQAWTFAWRFSHLVMDGWSFGIAIMDWLARYRAYLTGQVPRDLPVRPYSNYAAWWRLHPASSDSAAYWRAALAGHEPGRPLGNGGRIISAGEPSHHFIHITLGALGDRLRAIARDRRLTPATLIHGAWNILIARYQGHDDVVTGMTMAHRPASLPGAETILGPLIATVPARTKILQGEPAASWLGRFQDQQAAAREHVDLPLAAMPGVTGWDVASMETNVAYENVPLPGTDLAGTPLRLLGYTYDGRPHFAVTLVILPGEDMPLRIVYDLRRFDEQAAALLAGHLRTLLAGIADDPDRPIGQLPMIGDQERARLRTHAEGPLPAPVADTVLDRLATRVSQRPDAVAVCSARHRLTYGELAEQSGLLAARLRRAGAGPGRLVALCMSRSSGMIVGITAILRTGAAYLPLDPGSPAERLGYLMTDAAPALVLTEQALLSRLPGQAAGLPVVVADAVPRGAIAEPELGPDISPGPRDLMYVLYTSGSTGRPKGVPISHGDVAQFLTAFLDRMDVSAADAWSMFHSCGFDVSVLEAWGALTTGGRLLVLDSDEIRSPARLHAALAKHGVTVLNLTPSAFDPLAAVAMTQPAATLALRYVLFCGERLDPSRLRAWAGHFGIRRPLLVNTLGITETTVASTWHEITSDDIHHGVASPIGLPVAHQRFVVLDAERGQAPLGAVGELYVAGRSLSAGYLNRPELTRERFLPYPWGEPGERMYRTGDLVRRRHDGVLDYVGRLDDQVKIRGYRVEPAEVEAILRDVAGVEAAAVVAAPEHSGGTRLVAYVVAPARAIGTLGDELRQRLPSYMVPAAFVPLPELPLNQSGKLDRGRLPAIGQPAADRPHIAPRAGTEQRLARLLSDVLDIARISMGDELAALGVHSLTAMRIAVGIGAEFGVDIGMSALLNGATPASVAQAIEASAVPSGHAVSTGSARLTDIRGGSQ